MSEQATKKEVEEMKEVVATLVEPDWIRDINERIDRSYREASKELDDNVKNEEEKR